MEYEVQNKALWDKVVATGKFDIDSALSYCGDEDGFLEILEQGSPTFEKCLSDLTSLFEKGLPDEESISLYRIAAHSTKSSSKLIGLMNLSEMALASEMAAKESDVAKISSLHDALVNKVAETIDILNGLFAAEEVEGEVDGAAIMSELENLIVSLTEMDVDAMDASIKKLKQMPFPQGTADKKKELSDAVAMLDIDKALEIISALVNCIS